ncbi:bifunctional folylpolyglutamate synthase/dihydrofolate synthase [Mycoplasma sp. P36-A1]|uniref:bifunctional folylpolyglutamate synthase/dihydrofolate synthase n=1 Tax=Mycoplasma sp. P36-A1 TaxID=3252900 RepID=UPI003C2BF84D
MKKFNNIKDVLAYIENKTNFQLGLLRVEKFLEEANIEYEKIKFIHIAGTNGKGSVSNYLSNILINEGYKTGFFSSPSIQGHNDRIRINNEFISDDSIIQFVNEYYDLIEETKVTMFEIDVLMALDYFSKNNVEYGVIEVGMGGRFDGTNVIVPLLSIITNIGMDHTNYLGTTLEEIAYNKAGIIKNCSFVVTAEQNDIAYNVIKKCANIMNSQVFKVKDAQIVSSNPFVFNYKSHENIILKSKAYYQIRNACTVLEAIDVLRNQLSINISEKSVRDSLENITWPGRFEVMSTNPLIIIDGAHNLEGIEALSKSLSYFEDYQKTVLFTALEDKDTSHMLETLNGISHNLVLTTFDFYRAANFEQLDPNNKYKHINNYEIYIDDMITKMQQDDMLIITGSLYFITEIRNYLLNTLKIDKKSL